LHNTKNDVDGILSKHGFIFIPLSKAHIYKQIMKNLILHPNLVTESYFAMKKDRPHMFSRALDGFGLTSRSHHLNGIYAKSKN